MSCSLDQALLYIVDLRVDRCLQMLAQARTADPATMARLEAEVEELREDLATRFGRPQRLTVN